MAIPIFHCMSVNFIHKEKNSVRELFAEYSKDVPVRLDDSIEDVQMSVQKYINRRYGTLIKRLKFIYTIWIIVILSIAFFIFNRTTLTAEGVKTVLSFLLFPVIGYVIFVAQIKSKIVHLFYKQFADANGYSYVQIGTTKYNTGALFSVGHDKRNMDVIKGSFDEYPLTIFNYSYNLGTGKRERTYTQTVFEIDFKVQLPPVLLLTDQRYFGDDLSDNNLKKVSKIELPKAIEEHFNLFAEKKYEIEALQIFTPDVLAYLYDNYREFNYDFTGNTFYLYSKKLIITKKDLYSAYTLAQFIIDRLSKELIRMEGSTKAMRERFGS